MINRRKRFRAVASLSSELFLLLPSLRDALFELRHNCVDLHKIHLFNIEVGGGVSQPDGSLAGSEVSSRAVPQHKTFTLSEFSMHLKAQKIHSERLVDQFIAKNEVISKRACEQYLYEFLNGVGFNDRAGQPPQSAKSGSRRKTVSPRHSADNNNEIDPEQTMTYTERATMRTQCKKIVKFLRLVEFLISDALLTVAILSAGRLRDDMARIMNAFGTVVSVQGESVVKDKGRRRSLSGSPHHHVASHPLLRVEIGLGTTVYSRLERGGGGTAASRDAPPRLARRSSGYASPTTATSTRLNGSPSPQRARENQLASLATDLLVMTPNSETLRSQLETLIFSGLMAVTNRDRLLCNSMFRTYLQSSQDDGAESDDDDDNPDAAGEVSRETMDLDIMIMEEATFVEALQGINSVILEAYDSADESCQYLSSFLEKYQANLRFCTQLSEPSNFLQVEVEDFRSYLDKYIKETHEVDTLTDSHPCGLLLLDYSKLNAQLKPSPRRCLENLHVLLPLVLRHATDVLMDDLTAKNEVISTIPSSVDEYADSLAFLRKLQAEQDTLDDKYLYVKNLHHLVEDYGVKLTDNDQMNAFLLSQKKSQLRMSIDLFEGSCEQYASKFGIELEARLPGLVEQLVAISKALQLPSVYQLDANPDEVLPYLNDVHRQMAEVQESITQHFYYQKTLSLPQTTAFDEIEETKQDLFLKMTIWKTRCEWSDDLRTWERLRFPEEVDLPAVAARIQQYYQSIVSWEPLLSTGMMSLFTDLKSRVEEYLLTMPILADLRCDSFEDRHFAELHALLGFNVHQFDQSGESESRLTLGELVRMKLTPFSEQISSIATHAVQERLLKQSLNKITSLWERMEFDVLPYKELKDCYVLVSYETIAAALEESLMGMTSLLSSKYIAPIKDFGIMWQKRLLVFQETLDAWIECQRKWTHLETIFSAPDIQKQLPNEATIFVGVNQFWKDLMKRTKEQRGCLRMSGIGSHAVPPSGKIFGEPPAGISSGAASSGSGGGAGGRNVLLESLVKHNVSLDRIEKSLEDYLETKRGFFPRFYFISNDELLDILAHAREPHAVQRHLGKCFDALARLEIRNDAAHGGASTMIAGTYDIVAMISPEGERVAFARALKARGNVEDWLNNVLTNMKSTLHRHLKTCLMDYQHTSRDSWIFRHPAQAVTVVSYIIWARECESCLRSSAQDPTLELTLWHQAICTQLQNLTRVVRTSLSVIQRSVIVSLVTTDVHFRDIVEHLISSCVKDADEFLWQQQLRYYWQPERDDCDVLQANCRIPYGYEYMGVCNRLVITPLTDRCWMTITGALELKYGAAPSGPAGTGKTETSRDLAKALGILCVVINCSNQIDYKLMGGVFNGVVQGGAWVCLDEFNRIDIEVLSVIAQYMAAIRAARLMMVGDVVLGGVRVPLREHHIIVTMNPGYVGRTELPDNLKVCFRPVAMMIPDYALIAEIILFAEGYQLAKPLSRKITKLYKLSSEQLSQQTHYDFGMRAVRSVLVMAGNLKRVANASAGNTLDENMLLIRAVSICNFPRLMSRDMQLFRAIIRDLFPEASASTLDDSGSSDDATFSLIGLTSLEDELDRQVKFSGLQGAVGWVSKIRELFATLEIRTGIVQIGASGSGKTTAMRILRQALCALREQHRHHDQRYQRVVSFTLNPKSVSVTELYGFFHPVTREWTDGLASSILRSCITDRAEQLLQRKEVVDTGAGAISAPFYWVTFDGPIDAIWIESMNTVLDDNRTLCLANGERIKLLPKIQLVFEVLDATTASPATVSRLGVVYYDERNLGWRPYVTSWVANLADQSSLNSDGADDTAIRISAKAKARIFKYFDLFVDPALKFVRSTSTGASMVPILCSDLVFVTTVCHIFESLLLHRAPREYFSPNPPLARVSTEAMKTSASLLSEPASAATFEDKQTRCLDLMFLFSFAWSFGGNLNVDSAKDAFEVFLSKLLLSHEGFLTKDVLSVSGKITATIGASPLDGNIQDYFIDFQHLSFSPWIGGELVSSPTDGRTNASNGPIVLHELYVPTPDVSRYSDVIALLTLEAQRSVFLTGATGAGKSALIQRILGSRSRKDPRQLRIAPIHLQFSAQTSSSLAQRSIESKLVKKRKTLLGPPGDENLVVIVVDDINLPETEKYGAQPPIELLRQYLEHQGFYDREKFFWKDIASSVLLGVGGLPGGGRRQLCPRFVRHFAAILCLPSCRESTMKSIFQSFMAFHIANCSSAFPKSVKDALLDSVNATCELFMLVAQTLLPTPQKCHYLFNLRDAVKLMQGVILGTTGANAGGSVDSNKSPSDALTADTVSRLWAHESIRVFRDRLTTKDDREWLSEQLISTGNRYFGVSWTLDLVMEGENSMKRRSSTSGAGRGTADSQSKCLLFSPSRARAGSTASTTYYEEIQGFRAYEDYLTMLMTEYNDDQSSGKSRPPLNLVLFRDALVHTAAIARILVQPRGHALLLGMGGCGKRSLTRLAAFLIRYEFFEVELTQTYGLAEFRDDLKSVMTRAVLGNNSLETRRQGTQMIFLINASHLPTDLPLEDINILLNGGEIPQLFAPEEQEKIFNDVKTLLGNTAVGQLHSRQSGLAGLAGLVSLASSSLAPDSRAEADVTRKDCEAYFYRQVRRALHVVLCMDPSLDAFRSRVLQFPSLINCTTPDYFETWPASALQNIADRFLSQTTPTATVLSPPSSLQSGDGESLDKKGTAIMFAAVRPSLSSLFVEIHQSVTVEVPKFTATSGRSVYVTCRHYLDFLALFCTVYREKQAEWEQKVQRLTAGVIKLDDTNALVHTLRNELVGLQPVLIEKAQEAEVLLEQLAVDQVAAGQVEQRVATDESEVKNQQQEVAACQADAQKDLDQAMPALNAAVAALDALDKKDITEVKGFVKPPQAVQVVMEAVCIMLGEKPDWETSKRVLSRSTFMSELKEYDKDNINAVVLKRVRKYIDNPDFAVDEVKKVSRAAMSLCMWVHAIDTYARVVKEVAPKQQRLAELNDVLAEANTKLEDKQRELAGVVERVRKLQEKCDVTLAEKQRLLDEAELTKARLARAEKLTIGLNDERVRWRSSIDSLRSEGDYLVGDSVLAAAFLGYLGPFDSNYRARLLDHWTDCASVLTKVTQPFSLMHGYGDVSELREWQLLGLPSDAFSGDSAICAMNHKQRWPLMIDPQQQASQWIRRLEKSRRLETSHCGSRSLVSVMENCLTSGRPLLVEGVVDFVDVALEPLLSLRGGSQHTATDCEVKADPQHKRSVQLSGNRTVDVDMTHFRLYLTTKLANPPLSPDVFAQLSVINFTVTSDGLEDQLLSDVVQRERTEVEERKDRLLTDISRDQRLLVEIELKILRLLSEAKGNLLDDVELIRVLESSKATSTIVTQRLQESEVTKREVLEIRDQYRGIAACGAVLYFTIADLTALDQMYQYSLEYFRRLFTSSLDAVAPSVSALTERLVALRHQLVSTVYQNISRGLFEAHKQLFAFLTTQRLLIRSGELQAADMRLLDRGSVNILDETPDQPSLQRADKTAGIADSLIALSATTPVFQPLLDAYRTEPRSWDAWLASSDPYHSRLPCDQTKVLPLTPFFRLVLVRWLREDAFPAAVSSYSNEFLRQPSTSSRSEAVMVGVFRDMDKATPCLLLLSPGADPANIVEQLAEHVGIDSARYHAISLGQGQGPLAELKMRECMREGHWLLLQNVHLAKSWLPTLETLTAALRDDIHDEVHRDFRLFLAAAPAPYFPIAILQNSVKVTTEPPRGLKANLQRSVALLRSTGSSATTSGDDAEAHQQQAQKMAKVKRQLVLGLSLFHAALQERGKFGPLGWILKHEFSDADFLSVVSLQERLLQQCLAKQRERRQRRRSSAQGDDLVEFTALAEGESSSQPVGDDDEGCDDAIGGYDLSWLPWDALHFLTGQVYYGGRVTDEFDRRCLMSTLKRFYSRHSLETNIDGSSRHLVRRTSHRSSSLSSLTSSSLDQFVADDGLFCVPSFQSDDAMARFVDALPESDDPQVVGMHPNAHVLYQKEQGQRLIGMLWQVRAFHHSPDKLGEDSGNHREGQGGGVAVEELVLQTVRSIQDLVRPVLSSQPNLIDRTLALSSTDPFAIVLQQELCQVTTVLRSVLAGLDDLEAAVQGFTVMSGYSELVFSSLAMGQVPAPWRSLESLECSAGGTTATNGAGFTVASGASLQSAIVWVNRLLARFAFFAAWSSAGAVPTVLPLSLFCYPEGLFTAVLQQHARKYAVPIHHLDLDFRVTDDAEMGSSIVGEDGGDGDCDSGGVFISGLMLEGARWSKERRCLCDPLPGIMQYVMPMLRVRARLSATLAALDSTSTGVANASHAPDPAARSSMSKPGAPHTPPLVSTGPVFLSRKHSQRASFRSTRRLTQSESPSSAAVGALATPPTPQHRYACPVYKTSARKGSLSTTGASTNFVLSIELPCELPADRYVLNGTALICSLAASSNSNNNVM